MQITLKLFATLAPYLPDHAKGNIAQITVADDATIHQVLESYKVPIPEIHLVLINGVYINPEDRDRSGVLQDGVTLAIWPPVAGG